MAKAAATTEMTDQEYVESMVKPIVDNPDDVVTTRTLDERGVLIALTVNPADMGKVIGREGRTAKAVRSLLRVFGARSDARINLKIVEPDGGEVRVDEGPVAFDTAEAKPLDSAAQGKPAKAAKESFDSAQDKKAPEMMEPIPEQKDDSEQVTSVI
ncbi:MAG TPA: KH domain-containing protein [Candidatus Saccharimonadales bacterium]|nr:KH domain-containing protein [Candidatus Saccharimonadales bacterium]